MMSTAKVRDAAYYTGAAFAAGEKDFPQGQTHAATAVADEGTAEYQSGVAEARGTWWGPGLEAYGLVEGDRVDPATLNSVLAGLDPTTGEAPTYTRSDGLVHKSRTAPKAYVERHVLPSGDVIEKKREGVLAWDATFSVPGSVSTYWALATDEERAVLKAGHDAARHAALRHLFDVAAYSRKGAQGVEQVKATIPLVAEFDHRSNRHGAPQLHTHVVIPARVPCEDGVWRALDGSHLVANARSTGAIYQAALRSHLTKELGATWTPVTKHGQAEIAGVPAELTAKWSARREAIQKAFVEVKDAANWARAEAGKAPLTKADEARLRDTITRRTRPAKTTDMAEAMRLRGVRVPDPSLEDLTAGLLPGQSQQDWWAKQAADAGWTRDQITDLIEQASRDAAPMQRGFDQDDAARIGAQAIEAASTEHATFSRRHVTREVAARVPTHLSPEQVERLVKQITADALRQGQVVQVTWEKNEDVPGQYADLALVTGKATTEWFTTQDAWNTETRIIDRAVEGKATGRGLVRNGALHRRIHALERPLDESQFLAAVSLVSSGDAIQVIEAPAGTGKTTVLNPVIGAWQDENYRVLALAPTAQAASVMAKETGAETATVDRALIEWEHAGTGRTGIQVDRPATEREAARRETWAIDSKTVIVVDEAAMVGRDKMDALTKAAVESGAKIVLVGDSSQLSAVKSAGGMFLSIGDAVGALELTTVHRFTAEWEKNASLKVRAGDTSVIRTYEQQGRIGVAKSREDALDTVYDRWNAATETGKDALMLAATHEDVDSLNAKARQHNQARGRVHADGLVVGGREWAKGDLMLVKQNDGRIKVGGPKQARLSAAEGRVLVLTDTLNKTRRKIDRAVKVAEAARTVGASPKVQAVAWARVSDLRKRRDRVARRLGKAQVRRTEINAEWEAATPVRNGQRFTVEKVNAGGSMTVREALTGGETGRQVTLPRSYVAQHARYGWADTVHSAQGATADLAFLAADPSMTREQLYVGMTRGRAGNYVELSPPEGMTAQDMDPRGALSRIMTNTGVDVSATARAKGKSKALDSAKVARMRRVAQMQESLHTLSQRRAAMETVVKDRAPQVDQGALDVAAKEQTKWAGVIERKTRAGVDTTFEQEQHRVAASKAAQLRAAAASRADWAEDNPVLAAHMQNLADAEQARMDVVGGVAVAAPDAALVAQVGARPVEQDKAPAWESAAKAAAVYRERWAGTPTDRIQTRKDAHEHAAAERAKVAAQSAWVATRDGVRRQFDQGIGR